MRFSKHDQHMLDEQSGEEIDRRMSAAGIPTSIYSLDTASIQADGENAAKTTGYFVDPKTGVETPVAWWLPFCQRCGGSGVVPSVTSLMALAHLVGAVRALKPTGQMVCPDCHGTGNQP